MAQNLKIGSLLDHGKYRIEKVLGQGGFGITYLVTDLGLEKLRAIKEFFPKDYCDRDETTSQVSLGTSTTADFVKRLKAKFIKEARNLANLDQHQGIIRIHTVFEENNTAYYVMDYIEGESLSAMVRRSGPIPVGKAVRYIKAVGEALSYVHAHKINHLDVKPANIMVRRKDDKPFLIDFGLAKQYDSEGHQTSTTPTGISHGYAPIEQYDPRGLKNFTPQTDVYALAATLYFLVTGKTPPYATDFSSPDFEFQYDGPSELEAAIKKGMAYSVSSRPETVKQFLDSLDPTVKEEDIHVVEVPEENTETPKLEAPKTEAEKPEAHKPEAEQPERTPERSNTSHPRKNGRKIRNIGIVAVFVLCAVGIGVYLFKSNRNVENVEAESIVEPSALKDLMAHRTVKNLAFKSVLGLCSYDGEVDENDIPHGHGVATWESGDGKTYDGEWVHGVMEGQTTYTLQDGDTFVGTFKGNRYDKGRYTMKSTGNYFEGTFKNGEPDKGRWYDKSGRELQ